AKRPKTYVACQQCGTIFHPGCLAQKCCSVKCGNLAKRVEVRKPRQPVTPAARRAQGLVQYHIKVGHLVRPEACEECGATGRRIEAAHYNYEEPLKVRWLCRSCHVRWDHRDPKGGTVSTCAAAGETPS